MSDIKCGHKIFVAIVHGRYSELMNEMQIATVAYVYDNISSRNVTSYYDLRFSRFSAVHELCDYLHMIANGTVLHADQHRIDRYLNV